ncbi:MAG: hypothetical protein C4523_19775 [Myxococcales bacterium]|nr:MAG: hypothetical protein C4523_19775 [Myxococcales bacterium]
MTRALMAALALAVSLAAVAGMAWPQDAADPAKTFQEANALAMKGDAERALPLYESILAHLPRDPDVLYNAGTTALAAGKLGRAVLYLERAVALDPDCGDCKVNLDAARERQKDRVIVKPTEEQSEGRVFDAMMRAADLDALAVLLVILHLGFFVAWLTRRLAKTERLRFALTLTLLVLLAGDAIAGGLVAVKAFGYETRRYAVVLETEAVVRKGPNLNFPQEFVVHEGLKVRLGEAVEDWRQVWLENGLNGYIPAVALGEI